MLHVAIDQGHKANHDVGGVVHTYDYKGIWVTDDGPDAVALFPGEAEPGFGENIFLMFVCYDRRAETHREFNKHTLLWAFTNKERMAALARWIELDAVTTPEHAQEGDPLEFDGVSLAQQEWIGVDKKYIETGYIEVGMPMSYKR